MSANDRQIGGTHYLEGGKIQIWDFIASWNMDFFQGGIVKYVARWREKGGVEDLEKAAHYLEKYIEVQRQRQGQLGGKKSQRPGQGKAPRQSRDRRDKAKTHHVHEFKNSDVCMCGAMLNVTNS